MKRIFTLAFVVTMILLSCGENKNKENTTKNTATFERFAYFKSPQNYRVFVFITPNATIEQIKEHAKKQQNTQGCTTVVYYYRTSDNLNSDAITLAQNEHIAMEHAFKPNIIAGYWKYANGQETFNEDPYRE